MLPSEDKHWTGEVFAVRGRNVLACTLTCELFSRLKTKLTQMVHGPALVGNREPHNSPPCTSQLSSDRTVLLIPLLMLLEAV